MAECGDSGGGGDGSGVVGCHVTPAPNMGACRCVCVWVVTTGVGYVYGRWLLQQAPQQSHTPQKSLTREEGERLKVFRF